MCRERRNLIVLCDYIFEFSNVYRKNFTYSVRLFSSFPAFRQTFETRLLLVWNIQKTNLVILEKCARSSMDDFFYSIILDGYQGQNNPIVKSNYLLVTFYELP